MRMPWLDEYSNIGADQSLLSNLKKLDFAGTTNPTEREFDTEIAPLHRPSVPHP